MNESDVTRAPDPVQRTPLRGPGSSHVAAPAVPNRIGKYQIQRLLGQGGMGAVYLALQDQPKRTVALKMIQGAVATPAALRRFEYESQMLARLRHVGIAQVYEAGTHDDGHSVVPYFAMEYVPGAMTLTAYAEAKKLGVRERLELFLKVCDAVQHGHQRGVIHRDLKPANILVDTGGQPKIIDFGVARSADEQGGEHTIVGQVIGTLQYMSPEQCVGDTQNVDVRSDVYALGVVLYELLTGNVPYDLSQSPLPRATRIVCEQAPERPSRVRSELKGDLETIVLKALEKERERRYQSASELAADIGRFLNDEPILARPIGPAGRLVKWVKRNRQVASLAAAAVVVLALVTGFLMTRIVVEVKRTADALREAQRNLTAASQNFELVRKLVEFGEFEDNSRLEEGRVDVEKLLDDADARVTANPPEMAATEADFREILGTGYLAIRQIDKAMRNFDRTLEIRTKNYPDPSPERANIMHMQAATLYRYEDYDRAKELYERSLRMRERLHSGDDKEVALSLNHLGACEQKLGNYKTAETLLTRALEMRERLYSSKHIDVAASLNNLAGLYYDREEFQRAAQLFRRSLALVSELKGPDSAEASYASHNLGRCLLAQGDADGAVPLLERAVAIRLKYFKETDPRVAESRMWLVRAMLKGSDQSEARLADAEALARKVQDATRQTSLSGAKASEARATLAAVLLRQGRAEEAEPLLRSAVSSSKSVRNPSAAEIADRESLYGECLTQLGRYDEAEGLLLASLSSLRSVKGDESQRTRDAAARLMGLYVAMGEPARAEKWATLAGKK
ncbi:MAG: serine/threonine protein kinase [Phycisphaeraceae bacterium]|nr:serine/threonine protein kinase [Phycisphaeraceae bacterium]